MFGVSRGCKFFVRYGNVAPVKHIKVQRSNEGMYFVVDCKMFRTIPVSISSVFHPPVLMIPSVICISVCSPMDDGYFLLDMHYR